MRAVQMTRPGGPEVLHLASIPEPQIEAPGQIKVRLRAAGINPVDTKIRARGLFYGAEPPATLGCDGAGEIVELGGETRRFQVGDRVWFCHGGLGREPGNYAEFAVLDEEFAEHMPASADFEQAGAAPLVLVTAWEALFDRGRLQEGQTVLIHAGAGGVGHVAVQMAKIQGARVIATASHNKLEFVRALGADAVIDYQSQDLLEAVDELTEGRGVDLAFDTVGPAVFEQSIPAIAHYGTLVTVLDPGPGVDLSEARMRNLSIAFTLMLTPALRDLPDARAHQGEILRVCGAWMDEGRLRIEIGGSFPLEHAAEAHRKIEAGHTRGKLVLLP